MTVRSPVCASRESLLIVYLRISRAMVSKTGDRIRVLSYKRYEPNKYISSPSGLLSIYDKYYNVSSMYVMYLKMTNG